MKKGASPYPPDRGDEFIDVSPALKGFKVYQRLSLNVKDKKRKATCVKGGKLYALVTEEQLNGIKVYGFEIVPGDDLKATVKANNRETEKILVSKAVEKGDDLSREFNGPSFLYLLK